MWILFWTQAWNFFVEITCAQLLLHLGCMQILFWPEFLCSEPPIITSPGLLVPQFVSWEPRLVSACKVIIIMVHKAVIAWSHMDKCKGVKFRGPYIADAWRAWLSFVLHVQLGKTKQCVLCHLHMCKAEMMSCKPKGVITYYYCLVIVLKPTFRPPCSTMCTLFQENFCTLLEIHYEYPWVCLEFPHPKRLLA